MPVEQIAVGLGTSSHYDAVSATIRGKTVPKNGQNFTVDLSGTTVNFEIEDVEETPRSGAESSYSVSGRELRSEFLYRAVDFTMQMPYNNEANAFNMPSASEIVGRIGIPVVYDATDFRVTIAGCGWKATYIGAPDGSYTCKVRIREKNVQALLEKLFSWTSEFGKRKICWHVRQGTLYIWELQRATVQTLTITPTMCPAGKLRIKKSRVRKFSEITDTDSSSVSTPVWIWDYGDVPFSGTVSQNGSSLSYSNGYLVSVTSTSSGDSTRETKNEDYAYGTFLDATCLSWKKVTTVQVGQDSDGYEVTTTKTSTTSYSYARKREGMTTGVGKDVPVLCQEKTTNDSTTSSSNPHTANKTADTETITVDYYSLGDGFYGVTAVRRIAGEIDQTQSSISNGSPGGAASQYTTRQITGGHVKTDGEISKEFPGYILAPTYLQIDSKDLANEYLTELKNLHGAIEQTITAEVVGQAALNPIQGKIVYNGVEYYVTDVSINWTSASRRMSVTGIRWDYDFTYRKNILGVDEDV